MLGFSIRIGSYGFSVDSFYLDTWTAREGKARADFDSKISARSQDVAVAR